MKEIITLKKRFGFVVPVGIISAVVVGLGGVGVSNAQASELAGRQQVVNDLFTQRQQMLEESFQDLSVILANTTVKESEVDAVHAAAVKSLGAESEQAVKVLDDLLASTTLAKASVSHDVDACDRLIAQGKAEMVKAKRTVKVAYADAVEIQNSERRFATGKSLETLNKAIEAAKTAVKSAEGAGQDDLVSGLQKALNAATALTASYSYTDDELAEQTKRVSSATTALTGAVSAQRYVEPSGATAGGSSTASATYASSSRATTSRGYAAGSTSSKSVSSRYCKSTASNPTCQSSVDAGGFTSIDYGNGTTVYAAHSNRGGGWVNGVSAGQSVNVDGKSYTATGTWDPGTRSVHLDSNQKYLLTRDANGNPHLVLIK